LSKSSIDVQVGGAEAEAAIFGALTTPGTEAAGDPRPWRRLYRRLHYHAAGADHATHLAGAGDMVTMIIARELGLEDRYLAEEIKSTRWRKSKAFFTCAMKTAACSFPDPSSTCGVCPRVCCETR
jgi:hypothetical protein